jgi:Zn-dependent protease
LRAGRIFGIPIILHASWFIVFALITASLATNFRSEHPQWNEAQHWLAGIITSLLFFASVLFHELAHSVVALRYKIPVASITLFVFGGVARIGREAATWKQEFNIAVAGPLASYFLAGAFGGLTWLFPSSELVGALAGWLMYINAVLATFNLIPGFPLDGGRILRAMVWGATGNYTRATKFASVGGQGVAYVMILLGIFRALSGNFLGGLWIAFIGWFLLTAAQESYAQVAIRNMLAGLRAQDIMSRELPVVQPNMSVEEYVQEVVRTGRRCHLVEADGRVVGLVSIHTVNEVPREEWAHTSVQGVMRRREQILATRPEEPVLSILERMQSEDINQMPVVAAVNGAERVVGLVSRDLILRLIQTRMELVGTKTD